MNGDDTRLPGLLATCVERGASDLHISPGHAPRVRETGELATLDEPVVTPAESDAMARAVMNEAQWETFLSRQTADLACSGPDGDRFRVNVYRQRSGVALAVRRLRAAFLDLSAWGLPDEIGKLSGLRDGLVLVTGPTGSGKTTTLATLLHRINQERPCHILTVEDPIEYVHRSARALVHQRELMTDVPSFAEAVRSALREDPDVLLIGEMRDLETMRAAITAAETGHLVFSTLHTGDAVGAVERLIGGFPPDEQDAIRQQLSMVLRAVVAQRLLPRASGHGRVPAVELLQITTAVSNLIRTGRVEQIYSLMETGAAQGMQTMEHDLARLVAVGDVQERHGRALARNDATFDAWLRAAGRGRRT